MVQLVNLFGLLAPLTIENYCNSLAIGPRNKE